MIDIITDRQFEIIEAAGKILTHSGVGGLTTKNLAKEMKFSEAAIYRHFTSKEKILISMLEYLAKNMEERFSLALDKNISPEEQLIALFQNQFSFFLKNPHFVVAVFSDGLMKETEPINKAITKVMEVKMNYLKPIIEAGQQNNSFTNLIPASDLIHIVIGSIRLQMYKWWVADFQFDIIQKGDEMIQSLLTLIKSK